MKLPVAQRYAAQIVEWLTPYCEHIEIAGSIRRGRPDCNDVDLVCIPKTEEERDLLQVVTGSKNLLWEFLSDHVSQGKALFRTGSTVAGKYCILELKNCQLDVYFATRETLASRLLCRTGSKEHNVFLAQRAIEQGMQWQPYEGLERDGVLRRYQTESEIYATLGLGYIEPKNREAKWLKENVEG